MANKPRDPAPKPQTTPPEVVASAFVLVDSKGRTRARLALDPGGNSSLSMLDKNNKERVCIELDPETGPFVILRDAKGSGRLFLGVDPHGRPDIALLNTDDDTSVTIDLNTVLQSGGAS